MQFDRKTERKPITIQGLSLNAIAPFKEGHVVTANEAAVLNQTLAENLRNNFASTVADAVEAAGDHSKVDMVELQKTFDGYIKGYEFGVRKGGGFSGDPVAKEARSIAKEMAKQVLKAKGHKLADVSSEQMDALIEKIISKKPEINQIAQKRVQERQGVVAGLDLTDLAA
jgi:hypothetical protein